MGIKACILFDYKDVLIVIEFVAKVGKNVIFRRFLDWILSFKILCYFKLP